MINISKQSTVWFCKTELEKDNAHQLKFSSRQSQISYFTSVAQDVANNVAFVRESVDGEVRNYITVKKSISECEKFNYIMYKNPNEHNKFAFITRLEFRSMEVTRIYLLADSFQNWQFDITFHKSFIERQTPSSYAVKNTLSDSPATGQLVETATRKIANFGCYLAFCSSDVTQDVTTDSTPYKLKIGNYTIPCWCLYWAYSDGERMGQVLQTIANKGWGDRIISVVYVPYIKDPSALTIVSINSEQIGQINLLTECPTNNLWNDYELTVSSPSYGKEYTYPYAKVVVEDLTTGQKMDYSPEKFSSGIKFQYRITIGDSPSYAIIPINYEGQTLAFDKAVGAKCNTVLPNVNNLYANYLLQNNQSNQLGMAGALATVAMGAVTGNPLAFAGSAIAGLTNAMEIVNQESKASYLGNTVSTLSDGAEQRLIYENGFKISLFTMDSYHRNTCIDFWRMYGYPERRLAVPNLTTSQGYSFVKLSEANISGSVVPQDELENIKNMFTNGVTLWSNPATMMDY